MAIRDSTQRFSSRVEEYIRYRPGYPPQIMEVLRTECGLTNESVVADVGSGTGLLSRLFLENGNRVFGIEPNPEMRMAGERLLANFPGFSSVGATAEQTGLPNQSVDLVTAGQAAHWFDRERARGEFRRILKPGGWAMLVWNDRDFDSTGFARDYEQLVRKFGIDYDQVHCAGFDTIKEIADFFAPEQVRMKAFPNRQEFDYAGLEGRVLSASYMPQPGHPSYEPMLNELHRLFETHQEAGRLHMAYTTRMYYAQLT